MSGATPTPTFTGTVAMNGGTAYVRLNRADGTTFDRYGDDGIAQALLRSKDPNLQALKGKCVRVTVEVIS